MTLSAGSYLAALAQLGILVAASALAGARLRSALAPVLTGSTAILATTVLGLGFLTVVSVALGTIGLFAAGPLAVTCVAAVATIRLIVPDRSPDRRGLRYEWQLGAAGLAPLPRSARGLLTAGCFAVVALVLARFGIATAESYGTGMSGFDTTWYHGTLAVMMAQSGSTIEIHPIAPQFLSWFYPHGSELLHAIGMLAFERDLLSPGMNLAVLAGCMVACWSLGRPYGLAPVSLAAGSLMLGSGALSDQAGEARNDLLAIFFVLVAAAILVNARAGPAAMRAEAAGRARARATSQAGRPSVGELAILGLAAGLAAGVKLNYIAVAAAIVVAAIWLMPRPERLRSAAILLATALAGGGYWFLRNLVHAVNPLPWITSVGPLELPGPDQELGGREQHGVIEYALDPGVWTEWFAPGFRESLTLLWPVVLIGAILVTATLVYRGGAERAAGTVILVAAAAWLVTPASASGPQGEPVGFASGLRYLAPALVLAWALVAVPLARLLAGHPGYAGRVRKPAQPESSLAPVPRTPRRARVAASVAVAVTVAGGGYMLQDAYLEARYEDPGFATPGLRAVFEWARERTGDTIATTATRQYPLFGTDLSNRVEFVGLERPHGGYVRPGGCRGWHRALERIEPEYVVTAWDRFGPGQAALPPGAAWTASSPSASEILRAEGAAIYRLTGPLEAGSCVADGRPSTESGR